MIHILEISMKKNKTKLVVHGLTNPQIAPYYYHWVFDIDNEIYIVKEEKYVK